MTDDAARPYKLGSLSDSLGDREHRYEGVWDIEDAKGTERLVVAPAAGHIPLVADLIGELPEPFGILYVLVVPRGGHEPARYQSPYPTDRAETLGFLNEYQEYFERDGRHHLWVMSLPASSTLVYDNHNVIYAYGPLERFQSVLERRGLRRGDVRFPVPHTHQYNSEYDALEDQVMGHWPWKPFPLQADDS